MFYILTPYKLTLRTNLDLSTATSLIIKYIAPYRQTGQWTAAAEGNNATFDIGSSTIDKHGSYKVRVEAVIDGLLRRSSDATIYFQRL